MCVAGIVAILNFFLSVNPIQISDTLKVTQVTIPSSPFSLTSPALSLLLVFKTNAAYARFNMASTSWSLIVARLRDLMAQIVNWLPMKMYVNNKDRIDIDVTAARISRSIGLAVAFPRLLAHRLREEDANDSTLRNMEVDELISKDLSQFLPSAVVDEIMLSSNRPLTVQVWMEILLSYDNR